MSEQVEYVPISVPFIDPGLLKYRKIDAVVASRYRQAAREQSVKGVWEFPPLILEKDTHRVVSGNQRLTAFRMEFPDDFEVPVVYRRFQNWGELLWCFTEENTKHGLPLTGISKKYLVGALMDEGYQPAQLAQLLEISEKQVHEIRGRCVIVVGKDGVKRTEPIKYGTDLEPGDEVTDEAHRQHILHERGVKFAQAVRQVTRQLKDEWIKIQNEENRMALEALHAQMHEFGIGAE